MKTPVPFPKKGAEPPPQFSAHFYCGQTAAGIKKIQNTTWYGARPRPRRLCVRWGSSCRYGSRPRCRSHCIRQYGFPALRERGTAPPVLGPCLLWPRSPISATAELLFQLGKIENGRRLRLEKLACEPELIDACIKTLFMLNRSREFRCWHQFDIVQSFDRKNPRWRPSTSKNTYILVMFKVIWKSDLLCRLIDAFCCLCISSHSVKTNVLFCFRY